MVIKNQIKILFFSFILAFLLNFSLASSTFAVGDTILPHDPQDWGGARLDCDYEVQSNTIRYLDPSQTAQDDKERQTTLYCAIVTGYIQMWMIPFYIKYLAEFLIGLAAILCMLFIVIGAYHFVIGGVVEEKEKGKKTLIYAIMGLALVLLSWTIVNVVLYVITG